jgi:hypothetical protein
LLLKTRAARRYFIALWRDRKLATNSNTMLPTKIGAADECFRTRCDFSDSPYTSRSSYEARFPRQNVHQESWRIVVREKISGELIYDSTKSKSNRVKRAIACAGSIDFYESIIAETMAAARSL